MAFLLGRQTVVTSGPPDRCKRDRRTQLKGYASDLRPPIPRTGEISGASAAEHQLGDLAEHGGFRRDVDEQGRQQ